MSRYAVRPYLVLTPTLTVKIAFVALALAMMNGTTDNARTLAGEPEGKEVQTIDAGGMTFDAPKAWASTPPASAMRKAQLKIQPVKGDKDPAEVILFAFPGDAGGIEANIERWRSQFVDEDGNPVEAKTAKKPGKNAEATTVSLSGRYVAAVRPGAPEKYNKPDYALLGAIVLTKDQGYFLRIVGPKATIKAIQPDFDKLVASITVKD